MNFRYKLMNFMVGRYGPDKLFFLLFGIAAFLGLSNCFFNNLYLQLVVYAILIIAFLRMISKNITARRKENDLIFGMIDRIKQKNATANQRRADYMHIYKKCPNCKAVLRLPRRKGKHTTVCPKCQHKFNVRVFRGE